MQKRLHPERQALTKEELKVLVDHDDLDRRVREMFDCDDDTKGTMTAIYYTVSSLLEAPGVKAVDRGASISHPKSL